MSIGISAENLNTTTLALSNADTQKEQEVKNKIDLMEQEINEVENTYMSKASKELKDTKLSHSERQTKQNELRKEINKKTQSILLKYGYNPVDSNDSLQIQPMSASNSITITEVALTYDSSTQLYRYSGNWNFTDGSWDRFTDIEDLAGVRMTNTNGYQIYSSYCKTINEFGGQTGYVNGSGQSTPSDSNCTKRFEEAAGVAYNIIDEYEDYGGLIVYPTDQGTITQYIKKNAGASTNKIFLDFNHNYKYYTWNFGAQITSAGFSGLTNALSVSYGNVNGQWARCSGGKTIN